MTRRLLAWTALPLVLTAGLAPAQTPQASPSPTTPTAPAYTYSPEGRRDPFVSLLRRGTDVSRPQGRPTEGIGAIAVSELNLKGILLSRGAYVALVQGADTKTHLVRVNDRLLDGVVKAITPDTLVLAQDVNDPLLPTKQREVRKTLRAAVEQK
jgi:Tfp pilus assembly protein PilP